MELNKVQLNFIINEKTKNSPDNYENFVYWPASQAPFDAKFTFETVQNQIKLIAQDTIPFESLSDAYSDEFNYFVASLEPLNKCSRLICKPAKVYRMLPNYAFKDLINEQINDETNRLTKREQLDELKGKFGSKKSQRDHASKRKYEIQFGESDAEYLPTIKTNLFVRNETNSDIKKEDNEEKSLSTILPERNSNAKSVDQVYSLKDIITDMEEQSILEYEHKLFDSIKNDYLKRLGSRIDEQKHRMMAIYADVLLQMFKLSAYQMRKADPLPMIIGDIKKHIFNRYTSTKQVTTRQMQYVLTDQNKDRILIHIFILIIILNNYRPIELNKIQTYCSVNMSHIRRIFELIGCHIENMKNLNGIVQKVANFRLPLNVYKETNKLLKR